MFETLVDQTTFPHSLSRNGEAPGSVLAVPLPRLALLAVPHLLTLGQGRLSVNVIIILPVAQTSQLSLVVLHSLFL